MAETADYDPGDWKGYDYKSARKTYDAHVGRSYADASAAGKTTRDLLPSTLTSDSTAPVVIVCDVTGSMGSWPATIFSKLPYLDLEGKEYLGADMELCFMAVGDTHSDRYPLQARPFTSGTELTDRLKELVVEGGGGGQHYESYEMAALYLARNVSIPKAMKPIVVFIGDEAMYERITKSEARTHALVEMKESAIDTKDVFDELRQKFAVYGVRKRFDGGSEATIHQQWTDLMGDDHIAMLQDPNRVVDVIFGIFARETGRVDYFRGEIEGRQSPDQVNTVYKSLKTIHALPADAAAGTKAKATKGKSVMHLPGGKKTKGLLGK